MSLTTQRNTVNQLFETPLTPKAIKSYNELRKGFVEHLAKQGMDWKVGRVHRRTELFHKSLLILEDVKDANLINASLLYQIGEHLYSKRQNTEELTDFQSKEEILELVDKYTDYPVERYELKQQLKTLNSTIADNLRNTIVQQQTTTDRDTVIKAINTLVEGRELSEVTDLSYTTNPITITGKQHTEALNSIAFGFVGMRKQYIKQQLGNLEEIRKDQKKIEQIKGGDNTIKQETYWHYRKQNVLHSNLDQQQVLDCSAKVWSIFIRNLIDNNVTLPLQNPIKEYLKTITCYLLNKSEAKEQAADQLDFTPVIPNEALQNWDNAIKKEEQILDNIKRNDQRFFGQLVNDYESEFSAGLRKVFKLYDNAMKGRPKEIYSRSLAEVIHKVETGKLTKPLTSTFKTFLIGVGVNQYRQEYFKKTEKPLDIDEGIVENIIEPDTIERKHEQQANAAKVQELLNKIGDSCKELLEMKFLKAYNYEVMSIKTGKKEGALRTQVSRCLDKLRKDV